MKDPNKEPSRPPQAFASGLRPRPAPVPAQGQEAVMQFLATAENWGSFGDVEQIETPSDRIFLSADQALKIRRVRLPGTGRAIALDDRERILRRELARNAPTAPGIYRDVVAITREPDGSLALDGQGMVVEWVLRMARYPAHAELDRIAADGLSDALAEELGTSIALFHSQAPCGQGGPAEFGFLMSRLEKDLKRSAQSFRPAALRHLRAGLHRSLEANAALIAGRAARGLSRRGHGDLHLGSMMLRDGVPILPDAGEAGMPTRSIDVLYDFSSLLADLIQRDLRRAACVALSSYVRHMRPDETGAGLQLLPMFLAMRMAASATALVQASDAGAGDPASPERARARLDLAARMLKPPPPRLLMICGGPCTGKSGLARALAPDLGAAPGAVHLEVEEERCQMFGVGPNGPLATDAFSPEVEMALRSRMRRALGAALGAGHSVIVVVSSMAPGDSARLQTLADTHGARLDTLWMDMAGAGEDTPPPREGHRIDATLSWDLQLDTARGILFPQR